ncbi:MAG: Stp1/IreP family PP2C-type Ser/Thr phosphatase [Ruminococcaceae bacterium]|jgi:protein phosphatase|nr:Stp1/IreP family PP2C-type Ser/Thr phosphatase [Oscillospiraceae bacterium]
MRIWGITDTGLVREENQDAYAIKAIGQRELAVVCDGMGGTSGGQLASGIAVQIYQQEMEALLKNDMSAQQIAQTSAYCVSQANDAIRREAAQHPGYERMGTTLVSAVVWDNNALVTNIGDSRAYLISQDGITRITRDHSVVENMVENGELTPEEARHHPNRNLITRALGPDPQALPDTFPVALKPGIFLLLCTDGLVNTVADQEILFEVIHGGEPDDCLDRLLTLAKQRGAPDNVTAVLMATP